MFFLHYIFRIFLYKDIDQQDIVDMKMNLQVNMNLLDMQYI